MSTKHYVYLPKNVLMELPGILALAGHHETAKSVLEQLTGWLPADDRVAYVRAARCIYGSKSDHHVLEIDDNATVIRSEDGACVMSWCWVTRKWLEGAP